MLEVDELWNRVFQWTSASRQLLPTQDHQELLRAGVGEGVVKVNLLVTYFKLSRVSKVSYSYSTL